jgi:hypothetical protein
LFELPAARQAFDGKPLFASGPEGVRPTPHEGPIFAELQIQTRNLVRSVSDAGWKYIVASQWMAPEEREAAVRARRVTSLPPGETPVSSFGPPVREELYHLTEDPGEQHNRVGDAPEQLTRLRGLLADHLAEAREQQVAPRPMGTISEQEREQLRALGYLGAEEKTPAP